MLTQWWQKNRQRFIAHYCQCCGLAIEERNASNGLPWLLCLRCVTALQRPRCLSCGLEYQQSIDYCGRCLKRPPNWRRLYCVGDYAPPLSSYVQQFKFSRQLHQAELLAELLLLNVEPNVEVITFVPLHWWRQFRRGFNQSEWIARALAKRLGIPCMALFKRARATQPQLGMTRSQRHKNLNNAFVINTYIDFNSVAIVDDVVTTGSTVNSLCKLLLDAGVKSVDIYTICRTPEPNGDR